MLDKAHEGYRHLSRQAYRQARCDLVPGTAWRAGVGRGEVIIVPDGCMDLIWDGTGVLIAGPDTAAMSYHSDRPGVLTAIRFDPGYAPSVLRAPAAALTDQRVRLEEVFPPGRVRRWYAALDQAECPAYALAALAAEALDADPAPGWIDPVVRGLRHGATVARVARAIGFSTRQLQRLGGQRFGYGPKYLQRVLRADRARHALDRGRAPTEVAADLGYADYAHLHRDFVAIMGRWPTQFGPQAQA